MILLIDNYDSFTYNVKHYLLDLNEKVTVFRNDKISIKIFDPDLRQDKVSQYKITQIPSVVF